MTAVDRPDNGQDEGDREQVQRGWWMELFRATQDAVDHVPYAAASEYPTPHVAAFRAAAEPLLACRPAPVADDQRERVARWLFDQRMPARYWDNPSFELEREAARKMADELLALLGGPQPDEEPEPCPVYSHGTDGWHCSVTGDHDQHTNAAGDETW